MKSLVPSALAAAALGLSPLAQAAGFTLASPTVKPGSTLTEAQVFKGFGCEGKNISPALKWSGAPAGHYTAVAKLASANFPVEQRREFTVK